MMSDDSLAPTTTPQTKHMGWTGDIALSRLERVKSSFGVDVSSLESATVLLSVVMGSKRRRVDTRRGVAEREDQQTMLIHLRGFRRS